MIISEGSDAITIAREFDAPRELVFEVFTREEHLRKWFAPKNLTPAQCTIDFRVGGVFHYCMRAADGEEFWGRGVFREIVAPERFVYADSFSDAQGNVVPPTTYGLSEAHPLETLVHIAFEERGERTLVTLRYEVPENVKERDGAKQGWSEMFERAAEEVLQTRAARF